MAFLTEFVSSILIIDDKDEEVEELKALLSQKDLYVIYEHPESLLARDKMNRKDLVFLDFMLDDEDEFKTILSKYIRPIFEKHFCEQYPYGIVLWTKHKEYVEIFYDRLKKDTFEGKKYTAPLFIISLDKRKYLKLNDYSTVLTDIELELQKSFSASFLINWKSKISSSIYISASDIFHLTGDYKTQDVDVKRVIYKLAINKVGIPKKDIKKYIENNSLSLDAYKAFDDLLYSNLSNQRPDEKNVFAEYTLADESFEQQLQDAASINAKVFFETSNLDAETIIPGNIYQVLETNENLNNNFPKKSKKIAIELTPPCDFSQKKKKNSKLIGGFIKEVKKKEGQSVEEIWDEYINKNFKADYLYVLWPLKIDILDSYSLICFDFHCEEIISDVDICNVNKFKLLYRAKTPLFADILQKYSANKARLGIPALMPQFKKSN